MADASMGQLSQHRMDIGRHRPLTVAEARQLVIGKSRRGRRRRDRIVKDILEQTSGVAIHVIPFNEPARTRDWRSLIPRGDWRGDAFAIGAVATTTLVLFFAQEWISSGPIDLLYLVPVIASASYFGFRSGLIAAIAAGVAYNFFFLPPFYTFIIYGPANIITAILLVVVAIITGQPAAKAASANPASRRN